MNQIINQIKEIIKTQWKNDTIVLGPDIQSEEEWVSDKNEIIRVHLPRVDVPLCMFAYGAGSFFGIVDGVRGNWGVEKVCVRFYKTNNAGDRVSLKIEVV